MTITPVFGKERVHRGRVIHQGTLLSGAPSFYVSTVLIELLLGLGSLVVMSAGYLKY